MAKCQSVIKRPILASSRAIGSLIKSSKIWAYLVKEKDFQVIK